MTDKLAEEILKRECTENKVFLTSNEWHSIINAMQAYHEAKLKESFERENQYVTDEDIEAHFNTSPFNHIHPDRFRAEGAKAMRDGKIRHVSRDNK